MAAQAASTGLVLRASGAKPGMPNLIVLSHGMRLGRGAACDVQLCDVTDTDLLSRVHAKIHAMADGGFDLENTGKNGTSVGTAILHDGDRARLCHGMPVKFGCVGASSPYCFVVVDPSLPEEPGATESVGGDASTAHGAASAPIDAAAGTSALEHVRRQI